MLRYIFASFQDNFHQPLVYIFQLGKVCLALIAASLANQTKGSAQVHAGPENLRSLAAILLCNEKGLVKMARRFPDLFSMDPEEVFGRLIELKASPILSLLSPQLLASIHRTSSGE